MTTNALHTATYLQLLFFTAVVFSLTLKPALETLDHLEDCSIEIVDIDNEKDTDQEDKHEEDTTDEKIELQLPDIHFSSIQNLKKSLSTFRIVSTMAFDIEIPIPPPENV